MEPLGTSTVLPSTEIFTSSVRTVVFAAEALTLRLNIIARVRTAANTRFLILFSSSFFFVFPQLGGAGWPSHGNRDPQGRCFHYTGFANICNIITVFSVFLSIPSK